MAALRKRSVGRAGRAARATAGTDAIEVKVTVVERHETSSLRKFGLSRAKGERRRVFFLLLAFLRRADDLVRPLLRAVVFLAPAFFFARAFFLAGARLAARFRRGRAAPAPSPMPGADGIPMSPFVPSIMRSIGSPPRATVGCAPTYGAERRASTQARNASAALTPAPGDARRPRAARDSTRRAPPSGRGSP